MGKDLLFTVAFFAFAAAGIIFVTASNWAFTLICLGLALIAFGLALPITIG